MPGKKMFDVKATITDGVHRGDTFRFQVTAGDLSDALQVARKQASEISGTYVSRLKVDVKETK